MSWQAVDAVMQRSNTTGTDRMVLMVIATFADKDTFSCSVGIEKLRFMTNLKKRTLQYAIERIREAKEMRVGVGHGRGNTNIFTLTLPEKRETDCTFVEDENMQPDAPIEEIKRATERHKTCNPAQENVQLNVIKHETDCTRTNNHKKPVEAERNGFDDDPLKHWAVLEYNRSMRPSPGLSIYQCELIAGRVKDREAWDATLLIFGGGEHRGKMQNGRNAGAVLDRYDKELIARVAGRKAKTKDAEPWKAGMTAAEFDAMYDEGKTDAH